jgi:hypothetical protein
MSPPEKKPDDGAVENASVASLARARRGKAAATNSISSLDS